MTLGQHPFRRYKKARTPTHAIGQIQLHRTLLQQFLYLSHESALILRFQNTFQLALPTGLIMLGSYL
jgi:hypothetical protein